MTRKKQLKLWGRKEKDARVCNGESLKRINEIKTNPQTSLSHEEAVSGMGDGGAKKADGGGEDGSWQLGASTSRWAVVNSRYQVRTGCYQTFKAESIRLLLQQGEKWRCYQNLKDLLIFCKVSSESTDWKWSHKPAQLDSPLCDPQENARYPLFFPSFRCSLHSSAGALVGDEALCVLQMQWANAEWLQRMLLPSWDSWCTHAHRIGDCAGQKACSV